MTIEDQEPASGHLYPNVMHVWPTLKVRRGKALYDYKSQRAQRPRGREGRLGGREAP